MTKRIASSAETGDQAYAKRQKLTVQKNEAPTISNVEQLQRLLDFEYRDAIVQKQSLRGFKAFLDSLQEKEESSNELLLLRECIDSQKNDGNADEAVCMPQLIRAWSRASQINDDSSLSLIPNCMSLLLKIISKLLSFREQGIFLCKTLLHPPQLKLLSRGLTAPKQKEQLISSCLQLLNEIISFDGGLFAKSVYIQRDFTFKGLGRNLGMKKIDSQKGKSEKDKSSLRTQAVRFFISNLRLQRPGAKAELLGQRDIIVSFFQYLPEDPEGLLLEILTTLKDHVVMSPNLHRSTKVKLFSGWVLGRIATLYDYKVPTVSDETGTRSVRESAHDLLLLLCTSLERGIAQKQSGWYPSAMTAGKEVEAQEANEASSQFYEDATLQNDQEGRGSVRNGNLSLFIQNLKPWIDPLQKELMLAIFENAPELVADYFFKKSSFSLDPKSAAYWVGNSAFIYSVVQLPVPADFGRSEGGGIIPPLVSATLENLLPQPATQSLLTKMIQQTVELTRFYAIRLLVIAFEKLQKVLAIFQKKSFDRTTWEDAARRLRDSFCRRCPKLKDIIAIFRGTPENATLQREALAKLLSLYYIIVPQIALQEKLDISVALERSLADVLQKRFSAEENDTILLELGHLLKIAQGSPMMRWLHKPDPSKLSPFAALLKLEVTATTPTLKPQVESILLQRLEEMYYSAERNKRGTLKVLIASLKSEDGTLFSDAVFDFIDNCVARFSRKPVKYWDDLDGLVESGQSLDTPKTTPFLSTVLEQWPFVLKATSDKTKQRDIATWISRLVGFTACIEQNESVARAIRDRLINTVEDGKLKKIFKHALKQKYTLPTDISTTLESGDDDSPADHLQSVIKEASTSLDALLERPQPPDIPKTLTRWAGKDMDEIIEDNHLSNLIICLCSIDATARKQAFINISTLKSTLESSNYSEKEPITLLLNELLFTADTIVGSSPCPSHIAAFAARSVSILNNPQHALYQKTNEFLQDGPKWDPQKIPLLTSILLEAPTDDEIGYTAELLWLLEYLAEGLQTPVDMETFRVRGVFERLLALYTAPQTTAAAKTRILALVARASTIDGACTTLITRSGILSWIEMLVALEDPQKEVWRALGKRLLETSDRTRVGAWMGGEGVQIEEELAAFTVS